MDLIEIPTTTPIITRSDLRGPKDTIDFERIVLRNSLRMYI
jgi:hypothetical protein